MNSYRLGGVWLAFWLLFLAAAHPALCAPVTENESQPLAVRIAGTRFSATSRIAPRLSPDFSANLLSDEAALVAETEATDAAMQYLMRLLVTLPEVRIAGGKAGSGAKTPNLLALAHASAATEILLISRSKKNASVTVTVTFKPEPDTSLENRVRNALIHADRLALYEEAVLREKQLCRLYEAASLISAIPPANAPTPEEIAGELKALRIFKELLPQWNGVWDDPAVAREKLKKSLMLAPASPLLHNAVGDASLQLGRSQEAVEEQTAAIKADPAFARAYHSRGAARLALGLLSSAAADFSEAIRLSPLTAAYHRDRGMARHLLGETKAMCADFDEACALGDCDELHWALENGFCSPAGFPAP